MANIKGLQKYLNYEFSSGSYTGEDYKTFERKYINYLKSICKDNGWEVVKVTKGHYGFSAFFLCNNKYIYFNISDVRSWNNEWYSKILIRTAKSDTDYTGGANHYTRLINLKESIVNLLDQAVFGYEHQYLVLERALEFGFWKQKKQAKRTISQTQTENTP